MKDVVIVGGGPTGCFLGEKLSKNGFEVTILEEDPEIGQPMCCAGIVGTEGLKEIGLSPEKWSINELKSGIFYPPSGDPVELTRDKTEAHVIDRAKFDRDLAERAVRVGAEIKFNTRCAGISIEEKSASVKTENPRENGEIKSRMVVGADGTNSLVARNLGLMNNFSPLVCAQAETVSEEENQEAKVYFGNDLSQSFFGWSVPAGDALRIGLGDTEGNVKTKLLRFIENNPTLPKNAKKKIVRLTTDLIPEPQSRKIYGERVLLVGDAAGHVKPLTGGGLYLGLSGSEIASKIATEALEKEPSEANLREYENRVNEKFGKEYELGARARKTYRKMSDEDLNEFLEMLTEEKIRNLILENADFDRHSKLFKAIMEEGPSLIKSLGARKTAKYLRWFLGS